MFGGKRHRFCACRERFAIQGMVLGKLLCQSPVSEFETRIMSAEIEADGCLRIHTRDEQGSRFDRGKQSVKKLEPEFDPCICGVCIFIVREVVVAIRFGGYGLK